MRSSITAPRRGHAAPAGASRGVGPRRRLHAMATTADIGHVGFAVLLIGALATHLYNLGHTFIAPWDESVHAVVAEHLAVHPLHPTLYEIAALSPGDTDWTSAHTWIHIPPFGLLASALSMRVLGDTTFALRLPGVLFIVVGMLTTYLLGRRLYSPWVGLVGAAFVGFSPYITLLAQGYVYGDITDTPLLALTPVFVLALVAGCRTGRMRWYAAAGISLGLCYLSKGALGIAPMAVPLALYAANWLFPAEDGWRTVRLRDLLAVLAPAATLIGAYALYTSTAFPTTAKIEAANWQKALFTNYEGWGRPLDYHMTMYLFALFGEALALLVAVSVVALVILAARRRSRADLIVVVWILALYIPLSLAVSKPSPATLPAVSAIGLSVGRVVSLGLAARARIWRFLTLALLGETALMAVLLLTQRVSGVGVYYNTIVPQQLYPVTVVGRLQPYLREALLFALCLLVWTVILAVSQCVGWLIGHTSSIRAGDGRGASGVVMPANSSGEAIDGARSLNARAGARRLVRWLPAVVLALACAISVGAYWTRLNLDSTGLRPWASAAYVPELGHFLDTQLPANATVLMEGDNDLVAHGALDSHNGRVQLMFWAHRDVYVLSQLASQPVCSLSHRVTRAGSRLYILTERSFSDEVLGTYAGWRIYAPSCR